MKRDKSLELVKESVGQRAVEDASASAEGVKQAEALMYLGGIGAIKSLTDKLSAQTIRALEAFGESKAYERLGFKNFVDFLNNSPYSPMSKSQFYERLGALSSEGDSTYDLLNNLGVPLSKRKLLAEGTVQLDGDTVVVGEERVPLHDRHRLVEVIKALAEEKDRRGRKIEKGEQKLKEVRKERDELKEGGSSAGTLDEYDKTLVQLLGLYANLVSLGFELPDAERLARRDYTLARLGDQRAQLEEALQVNAALNDDNTGTLEELGDAM